ncbi:MAG TPA: hypothetical protein VFD90_09165 [Gaiellales bacterium]|jgi:hypothetical protein|nr:hypothetical protein [Gaiellales bacterium]
MRASHRYARSSLVIGFGAAVLAGRLARRRYLRWGASDAELSAHLPGDELMARADITATRAITIGAAPAAVWPWIAQLGQGRGGFYTYDALENLLGCDLHSADRIHPEWQHVSIGDPVRLHPEIALIAVVVDPGRALVIRGGVPMGNVAPPYDCTWAFVLLDAPGGATRLVVRERYGYSRWWSPLLVEPVQLVSFVMSRGMLRGIRERAERAAG